MASTSKKTATKRTPQSAKRSVAALAHAANAERAARGGRTGTVDRGERRAWGQALRDEVPRTTHGNWLLVAEGESRVQDLLPIRYGRMSESPFGFFRGAAAVMAADLADTPNTGIVIQLCGDGHLVNFGGFGT